MRILIGNDMDESVLVTNDVRACTQRILWLAQADDLIILMSPPDPTFRRIVASVRGLDLGRVKFHVLGTGRCEGRTFDHRALCDEAFVQKVTVDVGEVSEILALYPCASIALFAERLGLADRFSGAPFFAQHASQLCNNKACFRAFAAATNVSVPRGSVCRSVEEAAEATSQLLEKADALMIRPAHPGGVGGSQLVTRNTALIRDAHGAEYACVLRTDREAIERYWRRRWGWLSLDDAFPVIVEEFVQDARSVYVECHCGDQDLTPHAVGELFYERGVLTREVVPLCAIPVCVRRSLEDEARRIADVYRHIGYRGWLSAKAVVAADGELAFTGAQFTAAPRLCSGIARQIVGIDGRAARTVAQVTAPWKVTNFDALWRAVDSASLQYDHSRRKGVLPAWPVVPGIGRRDQVVLCLVSEGADECNRMLEAVSSSVGSDSACDAPPARVEHVQDVAARVSLIPPETLRRLRRLSAHAVQTVAGDLVECGVYKGGSAAVIGQAAVQGDRLLWLFDSFVGMPPTTDKDGEFAATFVGSGGASTASVRNLLHRAGIRAERYVMREGDFAATFRLDLPDRVAFLHIDADWYESVLACLRTFYDRVVPGGVVVLDDFGFWEGCREAYYDFAAERGIKPLLERYGATQAYWIKGQAHSRDAW